MSIAGYKGGVGAGCVWPGASVTATSGLELAPALHSAGDKPPPYWRFATTALLARIPSQSAASRLPALPEGEPRLLA